MVSKYPKNLSLILVITFSYQEKKHMQHGFVRFYLLTYLIKFHSKKYDYFKLTHYEYTNNLLIKYTNIIRNS